MIDIDSALTEDATLELAERADEVTVAENVVQVETASTQLGEVVSSTQMTSVALNGRSFTDLLALQPGIVPTTTQLPDSIVMAGVTTAFAPSGVLNAGNQSISRRLDTMIAYTFSKSIDQSSSLAEPLYPFNFALTRAVSAWDLRHNLVATYRYELPFDRLFKHSRGWAEGWAISGITRVSSGFPVTLHPTAIIP